MSQYIGLYIYYAYRDQACVLCFSIFAIGNTRKLEEEELSEGEVEENLQCDLTFKSDATV